MTEGEKTTPGVLRADAADSDTEEVRVATQALFVKLAERCLSHAHAKEQAPAPAAEEADKEGAPAAKNKKKTFPRITAFATTTACTSRSSSSYSGFKNACVVDVVRSRRRSSCWTAC